MSTRPAKWPCAPTAASAPAVWGDAGARAASMVIIRRAATTSAERPRITARRTIALNPPAVEVVVKSKVNSAIRCPSGQDSRGKTRATLRASTEPKRVVEGPPRDAGTAPRLSSESRELASPRAAARDDVTTDRVYVTKEM